jgi:hypothetical protein
MKVLEDVLEFFLGAAERKDIRISAVSRIDGDELVCAELDPESSPPPARRRPRPPITAGQPGGERARNPVSFVASNGQRLEVAFALEHVVSLRHGVTAVLRRRAHGDLPRHRRGDPGAAVPPLSDADMSAIDRRRLAVRRPVHPRGRPHPAAGHPAGLVPHPGRAQGPQRLDRHRGRNAERIRQGA